MANSSENMAAANGENTASKAENKGKKPRNKHEDFLRVAPNRVDRVLNSISRLKCTANRKSYSYSDDEVEQIFSAITDAVNHARVAFETKDSKFSFK